MSLLVERKWHMEPLTCDEDVDRGVFVLLVEVAAAVEACKFR